MRRNYAVVQFTHCISVGDLYAVLQSYVYVNGMNTHMYVCMSVL